MIDDKAHHCKWIDEVDGRDTEGTCKHSRLATLSFDSCMHGHVHIVKRAKIATQPWQLRGMAYQSGQGYLPADSTQRSELTFNLNNLAHTLLRRSWASPCAAVLGLQASSTSSCQVCREFREAGCSGFCSYSGSSVWGWYQALLFEQCCQFGRTQKGKRAATKTRRDVKRQRMRVRKNQLRTPQMPSSRL